MSVFGGCPLSDQYPQPPTAGGLRAGGTDTTDERLDGVGPDGWRTGFWWQPLCPNRQVLDATDPSVLKTFPPRVEALEYRPVTVVGAYPYDMIDSTAEEAAYQRATAILLAVTDEAMSRELWSGARSRAAGWAGVRKNLFLDRLDASVDITPTPGTPVSATDAAVIANDALTRGRDGDVTFGSVGAVHAIAKVPQVWKAQGHLVERGDLRELVNGHRVISAPGYTGSYNQVVPAGDRTWIYLTDPIRYKVSAPRSRPAMFNQATNRGLAVAEREVAPYFDACRWYRLLVTVPEG